MRLAKSLDDPGTAESIESPSDPSGEAVSPKIVVPDLAKVWSTLAIHARKTTHANGAAIVFREGNLFVCGASVGEAPALGTILRRRGGLFSSCIDTNRPVLCNDDASSKLQDISSRQRNCRSAALVPFESSDEVQGVLAVFSSFPSAFYQLTFERLSAIALVIESVLVSSAFIKSSVSPAPLAPVPRKNEASEKPSDPTLSFLRDIQAALPKIKNQNFDAGASIDSILENVRGELEHAAKESRIKTSFQVDLALEGALKLDTETAGSPGIANFDDDVSHASDSPAPSPQVDSSSIPSLPSVLPLLSLDNDEAAKEARAAADVAELAASLGQAFISGGEAGTDPAVASTILQVFGQVSSRKQSAEAPILSKPADPPMDEARAALARFVQSPVPLTVNTFPHNRLARLNPSQPATREPSLSATPEVVRRPKNPGPRVFPKVALDTKPPARPSMHLSDFFTSVRGIAVLSLVALCVIAWLAFSKAEPKAYSDPQTVAASPNSSSPAVPVPLLSLRVDVSAVMIDPRPGAQNIIPPRRLSGTLPDYPVTARTSHIQGSVLLQGIVHPNGHIDNISVLEGHPALAAAASGPIRTWTFEPASVDGKPVDSTLQITVTFHISE